MADDFATPLYHLRLKKRRRESEQALLQAHESHQGSQLGFSGSVVITDTRYSELVSHFGGTGADDGDRARVNGQDEAYPPRTLDLVSLWHVHGKR